MSNFKVWAEETPNPQSRKFLINQQISEISLEVPSVEQARHSPLATKLFGFPWLESLFIGNDFITITKQDWVEWNILTEPLCGLIKEHLDSGEAVVLEQTTSETDENDSPEVKLIKQILDREIRPQVALDGGDIVFHKYEDNIVYLFMKGACSGCPSATVTLKQGVEARLIQALPEIKEVVSV